MLLVLLHRAKGRRPVHPVRWRCAVESVRSTVVEKNPLDRLTLFVTGIWLVSIIGMALQIKYSSPIRFSAREPAPRVHGAQHHDVPSAAADRAA